MEFEGLLVPALSNHPTFTMCHICACGRVCMGVCSRAHRYFGSGDE